MIILLLLASLFASTFQVSPDQAAEYGILSYNISENKGPHKKSTFTVQFPGTTFTLVENSTSGSLQLKNALKNKKALNKDVQNSLLRMGIMLEKAQKVEIDINNRFEDFDVEIKRLSDQTTNSSKRMTSLPIDSLKNILASITKKENFQNKLFAYEELIKIFKSGKTEDIRNQLQLVLNLEASILRTQSNLLSLKENLEATQKEFISFSESIEKDISLSQELKLRTATIYLRSIAQTLNAYIQQTQNRAAIIDNLRNSNSQIDSSLISLLENIQEEMFNLRQKILIVAAAENTDAKNFEKKILDLERQNSIFYASNKVISLPKAVRLNDEFDFALKKDNLNATACYKNICETTRIENLERNNNFGYFITSNHLVLVDKKNLSIAVLPYHVVSRIGQALYCNTGLRKLKVGAHYVLKPLELMGWMLLAGATDTAINAYKLVKEEKTSYGFTLDQVNEVAYELSVKDKKYRAMQEARALALNQIAFEFQSALEEYIKNSINTSKLIFLDSDCRD